MPRPATGGDPVAARRPRQGRRPRTAWTSSPAASRRPGTRSSRAATRSFARKGYSGTRVADLVAELGITPQVLYSALRHQARPVRRVLQGRRPVHGRVHAGRGSRRRATLPSGWSGTCTPTRASRRSRPTCSRWRWRPRSTTSRRGATCSRPTRPSSGEHIEELGRMRTLPGRAAVPRRARQPRDHGRLRADARTRCPRRRRTRWRDVVRTALGAVPGGHGAVPRRPGHRGAPRALRDVPRRGRGAPSAGPAGARARSLPRESARRHRACRQSNEPTIQ